MTPLIKKVVLALLGLAVGGLQANAANLLAHYPLNEGSGTFALDAQGPTNYFMKWQSAVPHPDSGFNPWVDEGGGFSYVTFDGNGSNLMVLAGDPNWYGNYNGSEAIPDADALNIRMEPAGAVELWYRDQDGVFDAALYSHEGNGAGDGPGGSNINTLAIGAGHTSAAGNIAGILAGNTIGGSYGDGPPDGGLCCAADAGSTDYLIGIGDVPAPVGEWTHVVLTWSVAEARARLFLDGEQAGSDAALNFTPVLSIFRSHVGLDGQSTATNSGWFYPDVDIDEIKLWEGELLANEVAELHAAGRPVPEPASLGLLSISALLIWHRRRA